MGYNSPEVRSRQRWADAARWLLRRREKPISKGMEDYMELQTYGAKKYPTSVLMRSSAGLGWSAISAELRSHPAGETPVIVPQDVEVCLTVAGKYEGLVIRTGAGQRQGTSHT